MTPNDVTAALNGDTIYQNGSCANGSQCEAGETNVGNDGVIIENSRNTIHQGDSTTSTETSAKSSSSATTGKTHTTVLKGCPAGTLTVPNGGGCMTKCANGNYTLNGKAGCISQGSSLPAMIMLV